MYKVEFFIDDIYKVMKYSTIIDCYGEEEIDYETGQSVFQGSLSDCESYIRLHYDGYMD